MSLSLKIHKDLSFPCEYICKIIIMFLMVNFLMYFENFHIYVSPNHSKMDDYDKLGLKLCQAHVQLKLELIFIVSKLYLSDKQMEKLDKQIKRKIKRSKVITTGKTRSTFKN